MAHCININSSEFKELVSQSSINPKILAAKISLWQEKNGLDKFPKIEDLNLVKPGVEELFKSNPELANQIYEALVPKGYTRLYRAENEKGVDSAAPSWLLEQPEVKAQQEAEGRWFYKSYEEAKYHSNKFGSSGITYIDIPTSQVETFNAKDNKFGGGYARDGKEYFVSRELADTKKSFEEQKQQALQLYSQYLDSIFPDSKVKDIVYHGTHAKFDRFDKKYLSKYDVGYYGKGFYFSTKPNKSYSDKYYHKQELDGVILSVLLNLPNPNYKAANDFSDTGKDVVKNKGVVVIDEDLDNELTKRPKTPNEFVNALLELGKYDIDQIVAFEPEQIHILGSKDDIEGFKNFVDEKNTYYQLKNETDSSKKLSNASLNKVKDLIQKMGISLVSLSDYLSKTDSKITGVNALADLTRNIIAIAEGKEHEAITEEMVHVATAIIEQIQPNLITEMISKIDKFNIYKETLEQYKNNKKYQLDNGKPDIRKIKKEAVDKLIADILIRKLNESNDVNNEELSYFRKIWNAILKFFSDGYKKTNINIFEEVAEKILSGDLSVGSQQLSNDIYYQINENAEVDKFYNTFKEMDKDMILVPKTGNDKRHYLYKNERVQRTVTEKDEQDEEFWKNHPKREMYDSMKDWGISGHNFIERYIKGVLIDDKGYAKKDIIDSDIETDLPEFVQSSIKSYLNELISTYKPGTRFLIESKVVNTKVKGLLGSTIDFIAIEPNSETGVKVDKLDWKFTTVDSDRYEDVSWKKTQSYTEQMGKYDEISYTLGLKRNQLRKSRMIPFIVNYKAKNKNEKNGPVEINKIEIGNTDPSKENKLYLLPVAVKNETTGYNSLDELISSLNIVYEKIRKEKFKFSEKLNKNYKLNELNKAIKKLHMSLDFKPLINIMSTFINDSSKLYKSLEDVDFNSLTKDDITNKLNQIIEFINTAQNLVNVDQVYIDVYKTSLSAEERESILNPLETKSAIIQRAIDKFKVLQQSYVIHIATKENFTKDDVISPEKPISNVEYQTIESSNLRSTLIRLQQKLILRVSSLINNKANEQINIYLEKLRKLEDVAKRLGVTPFELIAKVQDGNLTFIKKLSPEFWTEYKKAKEKQDKNFFLNNMDIDKYEQYAKEEIESVKKELEGVILSSDPDENEKLIKAEIDKVVKNVDIKNDNFKGYESYEFDRIFRKSMIDTKFLSNEYKKMATVPEALEVWEFFRELNEKARNLGYLKNKGNSFFPLIEASLVGKLSQTSNVLNVLRDFRNDLYKIDPNEENLYAKYDETTRSVKKSIPKLFTRTNRDVDLLSKDLNKVGLLWISSLISYEEKQNLEPILQTLKFVEKNKGELAVNPSNNEIIYKNGLALEDKNSSKNSEYLEKIADDYLYNISEDETSFGNLKLSQTVQKVSKGTEIEKNEKVVSIKKGLSNLKILTQSLAVGLRALVAVPNYFGVNFQSFINSGNFYTFSEYLKNQAKVIGDTVNMSTLSTIDKLLLDKFLIPNEGIVSEKQRQEAIRNGKYVQWISNWSFSDVMMSTNSFPERKLQITNALSILDNTMIIDGNLVNIRQYVTKQDLNKYNLSYSERRKLELSKEDRINELQKTKSLKALSKIENDKLVIPDLNEDSFIDYRTLISEYSRNLNGQMNNDNKAGYRRDTIFKSFMMFKNWIPKQVYLRTTDIDKDLVTGNWKYGRSRLMTKVIVDNGLKSLSTLRNLLIGNEEGIEYMRKILEQKREDYKNKYNKDLTITDEEFFDMVRSEINNQVKELTLLLSLLSIFLLIKSMEPDDDDDKYAVNNYKYWAKMSNKILDELLFYYDPTSIQSVTSGNIIPQIGVIVNAEKFFTSLTKESYGRIIDDQELIEDNHPTKYFLNIVPGGPLLQREIIPLIDPELAKEMGIRVTEQPRIMR